MQQRMALEGVDRRTAERRQEVEDRTRIGDVRRAHGVHGEDPSLCHLMLDSTALDLDTCVELIVTASQARLRNPRPTPRPEEHACAHHATRRLGNASRSTACDRPGWTPAGSAGAEAGSAACRPVRARCLYPRATTTRTPTPRVHDHVGDM
jgi:hypothetical protein